MSAPMKLTAEQMRQVAAALDALSDITNSTGIDFAPWGRGQLGIGVCQLSFSWNAEASAYTIDDRNGD